ncbi:hypothetical protein KY289_010816 [Solanum tuberosum]|nr:hypothetical protein KY289_010816 [Solanum tuberosum]
MQGQLLRQELFEQDKKLLQDIEKWSKVEEQVLRHKARALWVDSGLIGDCADELPCVDTMVVRVGECITVQQQEELIREVSQMEIIDAIKSMPKEKALGVGGFPIEFFTENWEIMKDEIVYAMQQFFHTGYYFLQLIPLLLL